jgi:hypothetical protein
VRRERQEVQVRSNISRWHLQYVGEERVGGQRRGEVALGGEQAFRRRAEGLLEVLIGGESKGGGMSVREVRREGEQDRGCRYPPEAGWCSRASS